MLMLDHTTPLQLWQYDNKFKMSKKPSNIFVISAMTRRLQNEHRTNTKPFFPELKCTYIFVTDIAISA